MSRGPLHEHIFGTYISLRYGMVAVGALLPLVVYVIGRLLDGVGLQSSISSYYWVPHARDWFVGMLCATAGFLYVYKGFTTAENVALNLAAVFGLGVALIPTEQHCVGRCPFTWHGASAILMFVCLVYVVWFRARDTLKYLPDQSRVAWYRRWYTVIGVVMGLSPLTAFVANAFSFLTSYVFWIETAGILAFAAYWWFKSTELEESKAIRRALRGELDMPEPPIFRRAA
jgi:hypothetical protein